MLSWANRFSIFCFLDNHQYQTEHHSVECLLAVGAKTFFRDEAGNALEKFQEYLNKKSGWVFGHFGYNLKSETEEVKSKLENRVGFPDIFFFEPDTLIRLSDKTIEIDSTADAEEIYKEIKSISPDELATDTSRLLVQHKVSREEYIATIQQLQKHILRGDCYEINYCMEFFAERALIDPLSVYQKLSAASPNPFSALYKLEDKWLICASPERFLKKEGKSIISQPIKGTSSRHLNDIKKDDKSRNELSTSKKDKSENVMVVDLVRNDLARVCKEGTVKVDELFGVYSFPQVHQMISTVSGELKEEIKFRDIIAACFPMGSMTGAPKRRVLELIDQYEKTGRGIFSGALGYITPNNDFDFNVVIRSIMYNAKEQYLSFMAGSGITFYSDPVKEYEECLLKAEAIQTVITN